MIMGGWIAERMKQQDATYWRLSLYCMNCFDHLLELGWRDTQREAAETARRRVTARQDGRIKSPTSLNQHRSHYHPGEQVRLMSPTTARMLPVGETAAEWTKRHRAYLNRHQGTAT